MGKWIEGDEASRHAFWLRTQRRRGALTRLGLQGEPQGDHESQPLTVPDQQLLKRLPADLRAQVQALQVWDLRCRVWGVNECGVGSWHAGTHGQVAEVFKEVQGGHESQPQASQVRRSGSWESGCVGCGFWCVGTHDQVLGNLRGTVSHSASRSQTSSCRSGCPWICKPKSRPCR